MPKRKINSLMNFVGFTQEFQKIERVVLIRGKKRWESDADHSWQLAIVAWYIIQKEHLHLDLDKILKFAIVHDLVEIYAGDTYFHLPQEQKTDKKKREHEAMKKIQEQFPDFRDLAKTIEEYELKETPESRFVYTLDKILPAINIYLDDGRTWKKKKVTHEMERNSKTSISSMSAEIETYWKEFIVILDENKDRVFAK